MMWEMEEEDKVEGRRLGFYMVCTKAKLISGKSR